MSQFEEWQQLPAWTVVLHYIALLVRSVAVIYLVGVVFYFVERVRPAQPLQRFFKKDFFVEVGYPIVNAAVATPVFTLLSLGLTVFLLEPLVPRHVVAADIEALPFGVQVVVALLITDIGVYAEHRFAHRFLWRFHRLHHSTTEVSWLTYARVHPVNAVTIALAGLVSHWVLGFDGEAVAWAAAIGTLLAIWEHANLDFAWPKPLCYVLVSPHFHRWHHSSADAAKDKNFCLVFPFLDKLLGTYYCPEEMAAATGLSEEELRVHEVPETFFAQLVHTGVPSTVHLPDNVPSRSSTA